MKNLAKSLSFITQIQNNMVLHLNYFSLDSAFCFIKEKYVCLEQFFFFFLIKQKQPFVSCFI